MPAPQDKKKAAALRQVWVVLRRYFEPLNQALKERIDANAAEVIADGESKERR